MCLGRKATLQQHLAKFFQKTHLTPPLGHVFIYPAAFHFGIAVETLSPFSRDGLLHGFLGAAINISPCRNPPLGIPVAYD